MTDSIPVTLAPDVFDAVLAQLHPMERYTATKYPAPNLTGPFSRLVLIRETGKEPQ